MDTATPCSTLGVGKVNYRLVQGRSISVLSKM